MGDAEGSSPGLRRLALLWGATALSCAAAGLLLPQSTLAQTIADLAPDIAPDTEMLLEADTLIYDNNDDTVTASGRVRIDYGGNRLVADQVIYDRRSRRLVARGDVQVVDQRGTTAYADEVDVTDDFAEGFLNALRVETVDKTYFAAESAERRGGFLTTFNNGVYTACEPCEEQPEKAPVWRIKAKRIIWNSRAKTVRFENAGFEFLGIPLGILPAFETADPTVKRKTGFLFPGIRYKSELGFGVAIPYYIALSPTYDVTLTGTGYTNQGFLAEAEWRQRFNNGGYSIRVAGISQADPGQFDINTIDRGREGDPNRLRGMMGTTGQFAINSRWDFGWDILIQSDKNFSYTYNIEGFDERVHRSSVYLTGLDDRNFFDLRAMHFQVQEEVFDDHPDARNDKQPWVLPSFDYSRTADQPVFGGELNLDVNARVLTRSNLDAFPLADPLNVRGIEGESSRLTAEAEWKRSMTTDAGLVVTPLLAFQADSINANASAASIAAINSMASNLGVPEDVRSAYYRFMAAAGLELRFPVLFSSVSSSHILEPMAQVFVRPDEAYVDTLDVPNEDAQSFVFDATTLFERDKFSGYDRVEGGTRANIGFRYSASWDTGWSANGLIGQSYHIAGSNSFAAPDLVNVGAFSGLESDASDFVGLFGIASPLGFSGSVSARLDERTLELRRAELKAGYTSERLSVSAKYAYIQAQPLYSFDDDRRELSLGASTRIHDNWRLFGSGTYDFEKSVLLRDAIGLAYDDECFTYVMTLSESRDRDTRETTRTIGFNLSFRTLGDVGSGGIAGL